MIIYPAIDLKNGVCVRLKMGDMNQATEYGEPAEVALKWQQMGAQYLHVVDLDAAFAGAFVITSYSIHYTKLYEFYVKRKTVLKLRRRI